MALVVLPFRDRFEGTDLAVDPVSGAIYAFSATGKPRPWIGLIDFKYNPNSDEQSALVDWMLKLDAGWVSRRRETRVTLWNQLLIQLGLEKADKFATEQDISDFTRRFLASLDRESLRVETKELLAAIDAERQAASADRGTPEAVKRRKLQAQLTDLGRSVERLRKEKTQQSNNDVRKKREELQRLNAVLTDVDRQNKKLRAAVQTAEAHLALKIPAADGLKVKKMRDQITALTTQLEQVRGQYEKRSPGVYNLYERERNNVVQAADRRIEAVNLTEINQVVKQEQKMDNVQVVDEQIVAVHKLQQTPGQTNEEQAAWLERQAKLLKLRERILKSPLPVRLTTSNAMVPVRRRLDFQTEAVVDPLMRPLTARRVAFALPQQVPQINVVLGAGAQQVGVAAPPVQVADVVRHPMTPAQIAALRTPLNTRIRSAIRPPIPDRPDPIPDPPAPVPVPVPAPVPVPVPAPEHHVRFAPAGFVNPEHSVRVPAARRSVRRRRRLEYELVGV